MTERAEIEADIRELLDSLPPAKREYEGFQLLAALSGWMAGHGHRANLVLLLRTLADHAEAGPPAGRVQ